jgi:hypothetical protein
MLLRVGISRIFNIELTYFQWVQARKPVCDYGLEIRRIISLETLAYLASVVNIRPLQDPAPADGDAGITDHYLPDRKSSWMSSLASHCQKTLQQVIRMHGTLLKFRLTM